MSSELPSVASPRHFTLPLASSSDRSTNAVQKSHHRASVSTSANPTLSARRAAGKSRGGKRSSQEGLDNIGGSGEGSPVASGSPESTRGAQRSFQFPIGTVPHANVNAAAALVSNHNANHPPSSTSTAATAVPPISVVQSPRHLAPAGAAAAAAFEYQQALNDAAMLSPIDDTTVLSSISSALRAEEANENGGQASSDNSTEMKPPATSSASTKLPRMLPSLPPSFLASLVRSHVRHVGLSASLKRKTQVRELMAEKNERKSRVTLKARAKSQLPFQPHASNHLQLRGVSVSEEKQQQQSSQASRGASISPIRSRRSPRRALGVLAAMKAEEALAAQGGMSMRERLTAMGALPPPPSSNENQQLIPPPPIVPWPSWQDEAANEDDDSDDDDDDSDDDAREEEQIWRDQRGDELGLVSSAQSAIESRATRRRERKRRKEQRAMRLVMERADSEEAEQSAGGLKMPPIKAPKSARGRLGMLSSSLGGLKGSFAPVVNNAEVNVAAAIKNLNIQRKGNAPVHITTNSVREED